ncbi:MAG: LysM peptidoglycan-binding domain-containing protein [bacterium]
MKYISILLFRSLLLLSLSITSFAYAEQAAEKTSLADTLASEAKETQMKDQKNTEENNSVSEGGAENEGEPNVTANTLSNREVDNLAEQVTTDLEQLLSGKKEVSVKKEDVEKIVEKAKEQGNSSGDIQKAVIEALGELQEKGIDVKQETLSFVQESMGDILNAGSADAMGDPASIYIQSLNAELAGTDVKKPDEQENAEAGKPQTEGEGSEEQVDVDKVASAIATNLASNKAISDADTPEVDSAGSKVEASDGAASEKRAEEDRKADSTSSAAKDEVDVTDDRPLTEKAAENTAALPNVDGEKVADSIAKTVDGQISMATQKGPKGTITVVHGESLSNIARRIYGDERYYQVIFDANRDVLKTPNLVRVGQILKIPPKPE